jgi:acetyl esterase/lipase
MMRHYVQSHDLRDPRLSPLRASLHDLPPILVHAGADEILLDDSTRLRDRAQSTGGRAILKVWPDMWHDWHTCAPTLPKANQAIQEIAAFVQSHI